MERAETRIAWVDNAKFICIMCVIMSHFEASGELLITIYAPFFLNMFLFASGYTYRHRLNFRQHLWRKTKQLLIPWFIFSTFNIALSQIISLRETYGLWEELFWNYMQIRGLRDGMWFVAALFVAYIPFYFLVDRFGKKNIGVGLAISFALSFGSVAYCDLMKPDILPWGGVRLPWHLEYMFQAAFFMYLGYLFRNHSGMKETWEEWLDRWNRRSIRSTLLVCYLLVTFAADRAYARLPWVPEELLRYCVELFGIVLVIMISKVIPHSRYITFIGRNTLAYFGMHGKPMSVIQFGLRKFVPQMYEVVLTNEVAASVFSLAFAYVLSLLMIIPAWILDRYLPFVVGRDK